MINIRFATEEDALGIAHINYTSWQETYRGIVDNAVLESMNVGQLHNKWLSFFKNPSADKFLLVLANEGEVCGYCCAGKMRDAKYDFEGEVYALYLLKQFHGRGWGKALWLAAAKEMAEYGFNSCCVLVLKDNPSLGFYRSLKPDWEGAATTKLGDKEYAEILLGWHSLNAFYGKPEL